MNKTALTTDQIKAERSALNSRINMLQETQKAIPGSQYADQIEDLIKTALDLSGAIDTIAHGGVPAYDPATIVPRIHLAIDAADAIKTGSAVGKISAPATSGVTRYDFFTMNLQSQGRSSVLEASNSLTETCTNSGNQG